jgi:hypothetical protein
MRSASEELILNLIAGGARFAGSAAGWPPVRRGGSEEARDG